MMFLSSSHLDPPPPPPNGGFGEARSRALVIKAVISIPSHVSSLSFFARLAGSGNRLAYSRLGNRSIRIRGQRSKTESINYLIKDQYKKKNGCKSYSFCLRKNNLQPFSIINMAFRLQLPFSSKTPTTFFSFNSSTSIACIEILVKCFFMLP